jgi:hypothetical protein
MIGKEKERRRELCEQAANEYDPQKLHELVVEINRLLEEGNDSCSSGVFPGLTLPAGRTPDFCRK